LLKEVAANWLFWVSLYRSNVAIALRWWRGLFLITGAQRFLFGVSSFYVALTLAQLLHLTLAT
jgi:hypothetical protein